MTALITEKTEKAERMHCRVTPQNKAILQKAAALMGQDLTSFITDATVNRALEVIEKHERLSLSNRDRDLFFAVLENPPEPSARLKAAAARYKSKHIKESA